MIRIAISAAAYQAIVDSSPTAVQEPQEAPGGEFYLWLLKPVLQRLMAARAPGESYSDTILRMAA
jgi:hypothetical protein